MIKSDYKAIKLLMLPLSFLLCMIWGLTQGTLAYLLTQVLGAFFFLQCFILLHECGHNSFFKTKKLNMILGHFVSFLVFIPFESWKNIHELHHKWTGWRDKDPTTEKTFDDRLTKLQNFIVNFCWKFYIPLFTLGYRFGIYWKTEKLKRHLSDKDYRRSLINMQVFILLYIASIVLFPMIVLKLLPAIILSFVFTDIITLSQHSHICMPVSNGEDVDPLKYKEQVKYTRGLEFPSFVSQYILFNMNLHEQHHAYPGLPCYYLDQIHVETSNTFEFMPWLKKVKSIKGVDFVFKTSEKRDF